MKYIAAFVVCLCALFLSAAAKPFVTNCTLATDVNGSTLWASVYGNEEGLLVNAVVRIQGVNYELPLNLPLKGDAAVGSYRILLV